jgi:hypothetical protein
MLKYLIVTFPPSATIAEFIWQNWLRGSVNLFATMFKKRQTKAQKSGKNAGKNDWRVFCIPRPDATFASGNNEIKT